MEGAGLATTPVATHLFREPDSAVSRKRGGVWFLWAIETEGLPHPGDSCQQMRVGVEAGDPNRSPNHQGQQDPRHEGEL